MGGSQSTALTEHGITENFQTLNVHIPSATGALITIVVLIIVGAASYYAYRRCCRTRRQSTQPVELQVVAGTQSAPPPPATPALPPPPYQNPFPMVQASAPPTSMSLTKGYADRVV